MTTATVTTARTHESKAELIEALKQFAADRDMYQEEIDAKANRIPRERYGEFLRSQWYVDRQKNVAYYQRRCDMLAEQIYAMCGEDEEPQVKYRAVIITDTGFETATIFNSRQEALEAMERALQADADLRAAFGKGFQSIRIEMVKE